MQNKINDIQFLFLDNSVITKLRAAKDGTYNEEFIYAIKQLQQTDLLAPYKQNLLTPKLFLEIIGEGNIRKRILKKTYEKSHQTYRHMLKAEQNRLINMSDISIEEIENHIFFLECFWEECFQQEIPQIAIAEKTNQNLMNYPFHTEFWAAQEDIKQMGESLSNSNYDYNQYIQHLVIDSVIRYLNDLLNLHKNKAKHINEKTNQLIITVYATFFKRYKKNSALYLRAELLPFISLLKYEIDGTGLIRTDDDMVDSELISIYFYGVPENNHNHPVLILTCDPMQDIVTRMRYFYEGSQAIIQEKLPYINFFIEYCQGRMIIIDITGKTIRRLNVTDIITSIV